MQQKDTRLLRPDPGRRWWYSYPGQKDFLNLKTRSRKTRTAIYDMKNTPEHSNLQNAIRTDVATPELMLSCFWRTAGLAASTKSRVGEKVSAAVQPAFRRLECQLQQSSTRSPSSKARRPRVTEMIYPGLLHNPSLAGRSLPNSERSLYSEAFKEGLRSSAMHATCSQKTLRNTNSPKSPAFRAENTKGAPENLSRGLATPTLHHPHAPHMGVHAWAHAAPLAQQHAPSQRPGSHCPPVHLVRPRVRGMK